MREIGEVGKLVDANPAHRPAALGAIPNRCEQLAIPLHGLMAVHARLRGRNVGDVGNLHRGVTVTAIQTKLADVEPVAVRDRLSRPVAHVCVPRGKVVPDARGSERRTEDDRERGHDRELIPRRGEYLAQWLGPPGAGRPASRPRVRDTPMMTHRPRPQKNFVAGDDRDPVIVAGFYSQTEKRVKHARPLPSASATGYGATSARCSEACLRAAARLSPVRSGW